VRGVRLVLLAGPLGRDVVESVDPALVAPGRFAEDRRVREVPGGILEPPASEALVLPAVGLPRAAGRDIDARARAVHEFERALLERDAGGELR